MSKNLLENEKNNLLEQIKADIISQGICPDLAKTANNLVMGVGNRNAVVMFVGEAPGKNEDIAGEPFVGAAGKILNQALEQAGLQREEVYITNIVKYRPPNNRDPLPEEKRAFWPFLLREVKTIKPLLLVPLGRHAMEYFLPGARITAVRGKTKKVVVGVGEGLHEIEVMPVYHPAATIYNQQLRTTFNEDIHNISNIIKSFERKK